MRITYDRKAEAIYIYVSEQQKHGIPGELIPDCVMLDKAPYGQIYSMEVFCVDSIEELLR